MVEGSLKNNTKHGKNLLRLSACTGKNFHIDKKPSFAMICNRINYFQPSNQGHLQPVV